MRVCPHVLLFYELDINDRYTYLNLYHHYLTGTENSTDLELKSSILFLPLCTSSQEVALPSIWSTDSEFW